MFFDDNKEIDISGIDKAELLAGLFNASKPQGMGYFSQGSNTEMTKETARTHIEAKGAAGKLYFDYLDGRYMKVDISGDTLDSSQYDKVNGKDAAKRVVEALRAGKAVAFKMDVNSLIAQQMRELQDPEYDRQVWDRALDNKPGF